jgi:hypothetical protein
MNNGSAKLRTSADLGVVVILVGLGCAAWVWAGVGLVELFARWAI